MNFVINVNIVVIVIDNNNNENILIDFIVYINI